MSIMKVVQRGWEPETLSRQVDKVSDGSHVRKDTSKVT